MLLSIVFNAMLSKDVLCMWACKSNTDECNRIKSRSRNDAVGIAATLRNIRFAVPKPVRARDFSPKHRDWLWGKAPQSSRKGKKSWSYISSNFSAYMAWAGRNVPTYCSSKDA